ncbi:hypothetical protein G5V57_04535 [Nordella sp. HKS 07]|uniref:hypothetical protein n=1 Tax=Nordella sp. HKS 07 TaxID=2712222 RepID=UPI0013E1E060|nr:hypothetical protein [Nordella sp. HKS 07]QIG46269.1 hypothetical protein G5V57_04535 [Nordella sp. HKS 07]
MTVFFKASVIFLLAFAYLVATPLVSSNLFGGAKAFADVRDVGHGTRDKAGKYVKSKQTPGKGIISRSLQRPATQLQGAFDRLLSFISSGQGTRAAHW